MSRNWLIVVSMVFAISMMTTFASAQESQIYRTHLVKIIIGDRATMLAVVDGSLYFSGLQRSAEKRPTIKVQSLMFWRKDNTLQAFIQREEGATLKEQAERHLLYLTADYTTVPPRVRLTEKAGKNSQWIFESATGEPRSWAHYIRNVNDTGKPAWLVVGDTGKDVRFEGNPGAAVGLRDPVLTFENDKKQLFEVRPYDGPTGK